MLVTLGRFGAQALAFQRVHILGVGAAYRDPQSRCRPSTVVGLPLGTLRSYHRKKRQDFSAL